MLIALTGILTPKYRRRGVHQEKWPFSRSMIRLNFVFSTSVGLVPVLQNSPKILPEKYFQKLDGIMELYEEPTVQ